MKRSSAPLIIFALLLCGCSKKESSEAKSQPVDQPGRVQPEPVNRSLKVGPGPPKHLLHRVFSLNDHTQFAFVVAPHQDSTTLHGTFRSFTKRSDPDSTCNRAADVDLMLLNEQEFSQFLQGPPRSVTYELDPSHNQRVDWRVPATYGQPETYHLVFTNSAGGTKVKFVDADFSVSSE
jgi:hypothetical protein